MYMYMYMCMYMYMYHMCMCLLQMNEAVAAEVIYISLRYGPVIWSRM